MMTHEAYLWLVMGLCCVGLLIRWAIKLADKADKEEREHRASMRDYHERQRERRQFDAAYDRSHPTDLGLEQNHYFDRE